jgi:hypothetical protein
MPAFQRQRWGNYNVQAQPSDPKRIIVGGLFFVHLLPYFYGTNIQFDLVTWRRDKKAERYINYEWQLCSPDEHDVIRHGEGEVDAKFIHFYNFKKNAINIGLLSICRQYKVRLRVGDRISGWGDYKTIVEFTLKDLDDFYTQFVLPILVALFIGFIGGVIGWFIRGGK